MAIDIRPGESYTIRRQVLKLFGAAFHIYDPQMKVVGYCKQKAFKLREDIRIYTDESCTTELVVIKARSVIDFGASYDVTLADGTSLGSLRRKGLKSSFFQDHWLVFDRAGQQIADLQEQGSFLSVLRRLHELVALLSPQKFNLTRTDGTTVARYRQHFSFFVYRLSVAVERDDVPLSAAARISLIERAAPSRR